MGLGRSLVRHGFAHIVELGWDRFRRDRHLGTDFR